MSSLETIKQELIKQKALLESKGFSVPISNRNPTPTEISNAISSINLNFSETTATENDVRAGKTFISQTQGIRTGTLNTEGLDALWDLIDRLISGTGEPLDISMLISPNISTIRDYAFIGDDTASKTIFYANDLTIPSNITTIGENAFRYVKLTGKVTIPSTCTKVSKYSFANCLISEAEIDGGLVSSANNYIFTTCNNLKKLIIGPNVEMLPAYLCYLSKYIEEIVIRNSNVYWSQNVVYDSSALAIKRIIFETAQPCNVQDKGFYRMQTASLLVPYEYYDVYFNSTNYQQYSNPMYGYGSFIVGVSLPSTQGAYNLVWYASLDDLLAGTNPVTECVSEDRHYAIFTEIESTETTE